jgi:hypothetical protein
MSRIAAEPNGSRDLIGQTTAAKPAKLLQLRNSTAAPVLKGTDFHILRKNSGPGRKDAPQGLKANVFSIIYGTTKVVP